jgi:pseudoazurin
MRKALLIATLMTSALISGFAGAAEFEVQMLNKGDKGGMVFQPDFVKASPGDTIKFIPTDKGHNVESIKNMLPEGVEKFKSSFNKEYVLLVEKDGLYGVKCTPHFGLGMVALISVGEPVNEAEVLAVKQKGKAKARFLEIFEAYDASK